VAKRLAEDKQAQAENMMQAEQAKDGTGLVDLGMNLVFSGEHAKGLALMQKGIAKGHLKRPDDARLHLAVAQWMAGDPGKAQVTFRSVSGNDGTADLARLWGLHARRR